MIKKIHPKYIIIVSINSIIHTILTNFFIKKKREINKDNKLRLSQDIITIKVYNDKYPFFYYLFLENLLILGSRFMSESF